MPTRRDFLICAAGAVLAPAAARRAAATSATAGEAADRVRTKVVVLKTTRGVTRGAATGFLARPGLVLTAGHVVAPGTSVVAWVNGVGYRAEVAAAHPMHDLALLTLRAPALLLKPVDLAPTSTDLEAGEALVILTGPSQPREARGDPADRLPLPATFTERRAIRDPAGRVETMLALRASVRRGDSGSPVIRVRDSAVVGVLSSRELPDAEGTSHVAYAVPVEVLRPWLASVSPPAAEPEEEFYLQRLLKKPA